MSHEKFKQLDQMEANEEVLRNSELGVILQDAYIAATNLDPRLEDIAVIPIDDPNIPSIAFARPAWDKQNQTGKHEVHIRLNDLDKTQSLFKHSMDIVPKNTAVVAETLGIQPNEVTPQLMFVYSTLHEMGHTLEYMDYEASGKTPEEHRHDHQVERAKLPIGNLLASRLFSIGSPQRQHIEEHWDTAAATASRNHSAFTGRDESITTIEELADATAHVYRKTRFEAAADQFAATVLQLQPVMLTQLTGDITRFRNYPQNAGYGMAA